MFAALARFAKNTAQHAQGGFFAHFLLHLRVFNPKMRG
jgi:hypothetical protein